MHAVKVADGEVTVHGSIAVAHIVAAVSAGIVVTAVCHLAVVQFAASQFLARGAIDDRHIERTVANSLRAVVNDAVAIDIRHSASHGIFAPGLVGLVPEAGAVAGSDHHLAASVAVDVIRHHHIVLSGTDVHVRSHIHGPQQGAVQQVSLNLMTRRSRVLLIVALAATGCSGKEAINHDGIHLAIAVQVHGPHKLRTIVVACDDGIVEVEVEPHIVPRAILI